MHITLGSSFEVEIGLKYVYIKIRGWDYWKQWASTDIN